MLELDASIGAGEAPGYGAFGSVALGFPRAYFPGESFTLGDALIQTLASQHRELYLGHVQPRAVLWGVVDLQLTGDASGLGGDERLIQGGGSVGVEVVHYQNDSLGGWVVDVDQILYAIRPQSIFVRRSVTLMWRQPARGSQTMKRLAVPFRSYS